MNDNDEIAVTMWRALEKADTPEAGGIVLAKLVATWLGGYRPLDRTGDRRRRSCSKRSRLCWRPRPQSRRAKRIRKGYSAIQGCCGGAGATPTGLYALPAHAASLTSAWPSLIEAGTAMERIVLGSLGHGFTMANDDDELDHPKRTIDTDRQGASQRRG